jgi:hypothetical protein
MRTLVIGCLLSGVALAPTAWAADQVINLAKCQNLTTKDLHTMALKALSDRRYNIEEDTPGMIVAEQNKLKVEVLISAPERIVIRWKEGFGHPRDTWLRNLKTSFLWALAE